MALEKLCIIVPCYNEERRLDQSTFVQYFQDHEEVAFCFVDDGSVDGTSEVLAGLAEGRDQVQYISLDKNVGKAEAIRQGVLALENEGYSHLGYWDADLATPLDEIENFVDTFEKNPHIALVMGTRFKRLGADIQRQATRHFLGRLFATVASLSLDLPVYDTQCGAKIFGAPLYREIFQQPFITKWIFDVELLFRILKTDYYRENPHCIFELPLQTWVDKGGSKVKVTDFLKAPWEMLKVHLRYR